MAYTPIAPLLTNGSVLTQDHIAHIEAGIRGAEVYADAAAAAVQAGQVSDLALDGAITRAVEEGRIPTPEAQDLTISENQEGVYTIADGTGEILGLTAGRVLPSAAKTDLSTDITTEGTAIRVALESAGFGAGASDADIAGFVADPSTVTGATLAARFQTTETAASDFVNSWWCQPRSLYHDLRGVFYQGGVTREGTMQVAKFDLRRHAVERVDLGTYEKDDHNVPAFLVEDDKAPMVAIVRHAVENFVRVRVGAKPHDIASLGAAAEIQVPFPTECTYAHLIRRPTTDTVALLTRNNDGWYVSVSNDWGQTWGAARKFHGLAYATFRQVGHIVRYAITYHPVTTPNGSIKYLEINTITGDVTNAVGTVVGNLWTGTEVIGVATMSNAIQTYDPEGVRTFDIARGGSIAAMRFNKTTPELGGTYGVLRYKAGNDWTWEPIVASGVPVGYYQSSYVGGMGFGGNDDSVWLARESSGTWTTERWTKAGGTWELADTISTRTDGQLGRPQIPWGSEGTGLFTNIEYFKYPADTFTDYYGDQVARYTGITETVTAAPPAPLTQVTATAPTSTDLEYTIPARTGVVYAVNGATRAAGTYAGTAGQQITVTATAAPGYELTGTTSWSFTLSAPVPQELVTTGSLMYVDTAQWDAGVPMATVPNLADGSTLTVSNNLTSTDGAVERTTLGGLHGAISQTTATMERFFGINSPEIIAHMDANQTNDYFIGVLATPTRHTTVTPVSSHHKMVGAWGTVANDTITVRPVTGNKVSVVPSANRTAYQETATPAPLGQPFVVSAAVSQIPDVGSDPNLIRFGTGRDETNKNRGISWVLYAAYIEDLTVSGRSYAQVHAAFTAKHPTSSVSGDTWTAPATLAP